MSHISGHDISGQAVNVSIIMFYVLLTACPADTGNVSSRYAYYVFNSVWFFGV